MNKNKTVFVGVSGGVDSSVSLALLKQEGYKVVGVFIRTWQPDFISCTWRDERRDAMRVCAHLQVPFLECNLEEEYKNKVAGYMITEYKKGRTPNPDVMCNKEIKFGGFLDFAKKHGADFIATGHYAQKKGDGPYTLTSAVDKNKDQTYFLWTLTQEQLAQVLFPIGHLLKSQVRDIAKKLFLPTATKKDSQGVCFLGMIDMKDFLSHYIESKPGLVVNEKGVTIGEHNGVLFYTLGERHGFSVSQSSGDKRQDTEPYYIIKKNITENTIVVSHTPHSARFESQEDICFLIEDTNFIISPSSKEKKYFMRGRYRQELQLCTIEVLSKTTSRICFLDEKPLLASGQSCVFYEQTGIVIGGGVIS